LPSSPSVVTRDVGGSDLRQIYRGTQIHGDFWARPPTGPRAPALNLEAITVDLAPSDEITTAADIEPSAVEDALYNIAAVPVGGQPTDAIRSASANDDVAAPNAAATIELEGPSQAWVEDPAVVAHNNGVARRSAEAQVITGAGEDPRDYYSAALRLTEPRRVARTVISPSQAPVEDQDRCLPLPATRLNTDILEGPAHDWLRDKAAAPLDNDAAATNDRGSTAPESVAFAQRSATVVEPETDAGLVVAAESGTRPPSWTLAAALEPCPQPPAAATDAPPDAPVARHTPWKHPR